MKIPIFIDRKLEIKTIIGWVSFDEEGLIVEMKEGSELAHFNVKEIFGCIGYVILEGTEMRLKKFKILEFSFGR